MSTVNISMADALAQTTSTLAERFTNQFVDHHDLKTIDPNHEFDFDLAVSVKTISNQEAIEIELTDHGSTILTHTVTPFDE